MSAEDREVTITIRGKNLSQEGFDEARRKLLDLDDAAKKPKQNVDNLGFSWKSLTAGFVAANLVERGVTALYDFGAQALDTAGDLVDLKNSTGAGLDALQRWTHVAEQGGVPLEKMTTAAFKLGAAIANKPDSVRGAIEQLGLSFDQIKAMRPEDQFDSIMQAADRLGPSQERNALLVEIFGQKAAVELAKVVEGYEETAAAATVASDAQIEALDAAGDAWTKFKRDAGTASVTFFGTLAMWVQDTTASLSLLSSGTEQYTDVQRRMIAEIQGAGGQGLARYLDEIAKARKTDIELTGEQTKVADTYLSQLAAAEEEMRGLTATQKAQITAAQRLGESTKDISEQTGVSERAIRLYNESLKQAAEHKREAEAASKKLADQKKKEREEMEKLLTAWSNYGATLAPFTGLLERMETEAKDHVTLVSMTTQEYAAASAAAQAWAETNGAVLAPSIKAVSTTLEEEAPKVTSIFAGIAEGLPNVILGAIQGGGSVLTAAGAFVGQSLGANAAERWGGLIEDALPFGLGKAVTAMLPLVGQLLGPLLNKIGGFFRNLFGGPSGDELAGRELVSKFEQNISSMLTDAQRIEAGTDGWKQTVIGLRDAYLAAGLTEQEALRDAERLWASSKDGAEASARVIAEIEAKMRAAGTAAEAGIDKIGDALNDLPDVIDIEIRGHYRAPDLPREDDGYATGTYGRHGRDFVDFGEGTPTMLHGEEMVLPRRDLPAFLQRMLGGTPAPAAAAAPHVYIVNDLAGARQVDEQAYRAVVQRLLSTGQLTVPERVVVSR